MANSISNVGSLSNATTSGPIQDPAKQSQLSGGDASQWSRSDWNKLPADQQQRILNALDQMNQDGAAGQSLDAGAAPPVSQANGTPNRA
jgi:hypothetical protein